MHLEYDATLTEITTHLSKQQLIFCRDIYYVYIQV